MGDRDADLIRRALGVPEFEDDDADRVVLLLARDALETMERRILIMREALDEIQRHCGEWPGGDKIPDRDGLWAGRIANAALREAYDAS